MRSAIVAMGWLALTACGGPADEGTDDTDVPETDDTDVPETDDTDVVETDDTDVVETDATDGTDATDETDAAPTRRWCYGAGEHSAGETAVSWYDTSTTAQVWPDGSVYDWTQRERLKTSTPARAAFAYLGWTPTRLLLGLRHPGLTVGRADLELVAYLGDETSTARVGLPGVAETPDLTVPASWAVRWPTTGGSPSLQRWDGASWQVEVLPADLVAVRLTDAPGVEVAVPFSLLGCSGTTTASWMLVDRADAGRTTASSPANAVEEGPDADVTCAYTFDPKRQKAFNQVRHSCDQGRRPVAESDTAL